jgi:hypothetical protein
MALLEHDFIIQYKKGSDMPANYLSRLPATTHDSTNDSVIAAFDPFQTDLPELQREEPYAKNMLYFGKHKRWPDHFSKSEANYHADLLKRMFHDKDRIMWVRLTDYKYPRTALLLPWKYQKEALCEAHNSIFGGHDASLKNVHEDFFLILLARTLQGHQNARPDLPYLPTKKMSYHQADSAAAITNT